MKANLTLLLLLIGAAIYVGLQTGRGVKIVTEQSVDAGHEPAKAAPDANKDVEPLKPEVTKRAPVFEARPPENLGMLDLMSALAGSLAREAMTGRSDLPKDPP